MEKIKTDINGNNEVHNEDCHHYNQLISYEGLGYHYGCKSAVAEAKNRAMGT